MVRYSGLFHGMLALAESPAEQPTNPITDADRAKSADNRYAIRQTLTQALELKELAYQTAKAIQPRIQSLASEGQAQATLGSQETRAIAQSVTALCKAFADMVTIIRIERGKPLPGSLRPESKPTKRKSQPTMFSENRPE